MVIDNVFGRLNSATRQWQPASRGFLFHVVSVISRQLARVWCGMRGHLIMLHFEPNKLSLQCSLCGYESQGWEVGRPMAARRQADNRIARPERRRTLRPLPTNARLAS
jgi:hypothetical protein